jgi:hypothetical protein
MLESVSTGIARNLEAMRGGKGAAQLAGAADDAAPQLAGLTADPVFIVPGLTADRWMYRKAKEMLEAEGFVVGGMRMPWHGWGGIPGDAKLMHVHVERTIERAQKMGRDVDRVQVVGDSEGGLISRQFLQFENGMPLVSRLVTNGTPHGGIRPLGSDRIAALGQRILMPPGVKDLLTSSPVMHRLNDDWPDFLTRARKADPGFEAHAIASRIFGMIGHDGLVPQHSAQMTGAPPVVHNYATSGAHSVNLAGGRRQTEAGHILMAALGSREPEALEAATRARGTAQATAGVQALIAH